MMGQYSNFIYKYEMLIIFNISHFLILVGSILHAHHTPALDIGHYYMTLIHQSTQPGPHSMQPSQWCSGSSNITSLTLPNLF